MKFHNFVCNEMYVHFSSRDDDAYGRKQIVGGYISRHVSTPKYVFVTQYVRLLATAGNAQCALLNDYTCNTNCVTGAENTYKIMREAIFDLIFSS